MNLLRFARLSAWLTLFTASAALTAAFAEGTIRPSSEGRIGFIAGSATNAETWDFKPSRWGRYDIEAAVSGSEKGAQLVIEIAGQTFGVVLPVGADKRRTTVVPVSRFYLPKSDPCKVKAGPKAGTPGGFTLHGINGGAECHVWARIERDRDRWKLPIVLNTLRSNALRKSRDGTELNQVAGIGANEKLT